METACLCVSMLDLLHRLCMADPQLDLEPMRRIRGSQYVLDMMVRLANNLDGTLGGLESSSSAYKDDFHGRRRHLRQRWRRWHRPSALTAVAGSAVHACAHACIRACVRACMRACMRACVRMPRHACTHVRGQVYERAYACMQAYAETCVHACVQACMQLSVQACNQVYTQARVYACV